MVKVIVMDVDGTLTDGKIYVGNQGEVFKAFNVKDGYAISNIMKDNGIIPIIITARESDIVKKRCNELSIIHCYQGVTNKLEKMLEVIRMLGIEVDDGKVEGLAYIGDDIPDLECIQRAEYSACPSDAVNVVRRRVDIVLESKGGEGAVREFVEKLLEIRGRVTYGENKNISSGKL